MAQSTPKTALHPRNKHRFGYDLALLCKAVPELSSALITTAQGKTSVDFANPDAVKHLNAALLKTDYGIAFWDIPAGYLCPPIPGRVDYLHYLADLLAEGHGSIPTGKQIRGLDIGAGANCIYPLLAACEYGWQFTAVDIDPVAVQTAKALVQANANVRSHIKIMQQPKPEHIFQGVIKAGQWYDITLCNPPFHVSAEQAAEGSARKQKNLGHTGKALNFGGQSNELWCEGGEFGFIRRMISESTQFADQCYWFTTLVSKSDHLDGLQRELKKAGAVQVRIIAMAQGNKQSRFLAWSFLTPEEQALWREARWGNS